QSKAFRVYNLETKRVEENPHITFLENKPNVAGKGPTWLFDLDYLIDSMNDPPVRSENQANKHVGQQEANYNAGTEDIIDAGDSEKEDEYAIDCFVLPIWSSYSSTITHELKTDAKREGPREEEQVFLDDYKKGKKTTRDIVCNLVLWKFWTNQKHVSESFHIKGIAFLIHLESDVMLLIGNCSLKLLHIDGRNTGSDQEGWIKRSENVVPLEQEHRPKLVVVL
ncbi:hypothetical protein Tco_1388761, partial [Tanacetum coccineum]